MERFHGTAARQLVLIEEEPGGAQAAWPGVRDRTSQRGHRLRLMQRDMYAELARRRRQAQIAARRWVDRAE